jgi:hypothetical protein
MNRKTYALPPSLCNVSDETPHLGLRTVNAEDPSWKIGPRSRTMRFSMKIASLTAVLLLLQITPTDRLSSTNAATVFSKFAARATQSGAEKRDKQHSVTLQWHPSTSAVAGYNVYRSAKPGGPYKKLNARPTSGTSYQDSTVRPGATYYYVVKSVTPKNVESIASDEISAVIPAQ